MKRSTILKIIAVTLPLNIAFLVYLVLQEKEPYTTPANDTVSAQQTVVSEPASQAPAKAAEKAKDASTGLDLEITQAGIGPVKLGMTLAQAQQALPMARFVRTSDGEGIALVEAIVAEQPVLKMFADEPDPSKPIDMSKTIKMLETSNPKAYSAEGIVTPNLLIAVAESRVGATQKIIRSEIESREYITFAKAPAYLSIRVEGAVFPEGKSETQTYRPDAKIKSISISRF